MYKAENMETNYLGTTPALYPRAPISIVHPGNSFIQCSPIGQPLVKGSVFRPKPMIKPMVVVEDTDTGTITTDDEFERALEDNIWVDTTFETPNRSRSSSHATNGLGNLLMINDNTDDEEDGPAPARPPPPAWEKDIIVSHPKNPPTPPPRGHPLKNFSFPAAPPAPPPRFSSTCRAATLPRPAGSKAPDNRDKKHVSKIHCMINFQPSTAVNSVTRTKGYSASLPRNMGRMKNKDCRASILINTGLRKDDKPKFHQSASLFVEPEKDTPLNLSNGDFTKRSTNGFSHFTNEDDEQDDDFYIPPIKMPPLHKYNGILKSQQYRDIFAQTGKSATLPRSFSHGSVLSGNKKKPILRSPSPLVLMPVSQNSLEQPQNHSTSLTLFSRPKTDLGWRTPQLQRSSKMNPQLNSSIRPSQSSFDLRNSPMINGEYTIFTDKSLNPSFPLEPPPPLFNNMDGRLSPFPVESGRVTPFLAEMERQLQLTPELGRKSPFMSGIPGANNPFMDGSGRLSPYPTDISRGPSPIPDGRESPLPTQQGRIIRVFHAPGKAFTETIESPFLSADNRMSPFQADTGRMSPFPLDNDCSSAQLGYTRRTSPYIGSSMPDMARFGEQHNGNPTPGNIQQYASGPMLYEEMDYDNLDSFQTVPSQRKQKPVITHHITRVTSSDPANNLDDYDNLNLASRSAMGPAGSMVIRPGQARSVKHDKSIDNPHFPDADDPRRRSLIWVKGYR